MIRCCRMIRRKWEVYRDKMHKNKVLTWTKTKAKSKWNLSSIWFNLSTVVKLPSHSASFLVKDYNINKYMHIL